MGRISWRGYKGWADAKGEMSEDCDKIVFDVSNAVKVILEKNNLWYAIPPTTPVSLLPTNEHGCFNWESILRFHFDE
jgi:hypothetical protein